MSDLSRLLDDVYRSGASTPAAPAWSSDDALEEVFADWVPGESEGASAAEQAFAQLADPDPEYEPVERGMDQLDALVEAAASMTPVGDEPVDAPFDQSRFEDAFAEVFMTPAEPEPVADEPVATDPAPEPALEAEPEPVMWEAPLRWTPEREIEEPAPLTPVAAPVATAMWCRQDDDILPRRGLGGRSRRLSLRRK